MGTADIPIKQSVLNINNNRQRATVRFQPSPSADVPRKNNSEDFLSEQKFGELF